MDIMSVNRLKFLIFKNSLLFIILGFIVVIIFQIINKNYVISAVLFVFLLFSTAIIGKMIAPAYLSRRLLVFILKNSGRVNVSQIYSMIDYSNDTVDYLLRELFKKYLIELNQQERVIITEKGVEQLKTWGYKVKRPRVTS